MDIIFNPIKQIIKKGNNPKSEEKVYQIPHKGTWYLFIELIPSWGKGEYSLRLSNSFEYSTIPKKVYKICNGQIEKLAYSTPSKPEGNLSYTAFNFRAGLI